LPQYFFLNIPVTRMTGSGCNSEEFRQFFYMSCLDCSLKHVFERVGPIASAPDRRTKIYRPVHGQGFKRARHTFFKLINRFINKYRAIFTTVYKLNLYSLFKWTKKTLGHENWCEHENINEPKRNLEVLKIRNIQIYCSYRMKGLSGYPYPSSFWHFLEISSRRSVRFFILLIRRHYSGWHIIFVLLTGGAHRRKLRRTFWSILFGWNNIYIGNCIFYHRGKFN
jgi:hypothetical protein